MDLTFKKTLLVLLLLGALCPLLHADPVRVYLFTDPDCGSCRTVKEYLNKIGRENKIDVVEFDVFEELPLLRPVTRKFGYVPREVPIVLIGEAIIEGSGTYEEYLDAVKRFERDEFGPLLGEKKTRLEIPPLWAVLAGGLADGINPCAFAVIIFMAIYLGAAGKDRKTLFVIMGFFGTGVFTAYLLMGLGLRRVLGLVYNTTGVRNVFNTALACLLFILSLLSLIDFFRGKKKKESLLKLTDSSRRTINRYIVRAVSAKRASLAAFATGLIVSLIEIACTGQVYLPVISIIVKEGRGLGLLVLYNIMFVLPLFAVGAALAGGMSSSRLRTFFNKHYHYAKAALALLFLSLGLLLLI